MAILTAFILRKSRLSILWKLQLFKAYHAAYFHRDNIWIKHKLCLDLLKALKVKVLQGHCTMEGSEALFSQPFWPATLYHGSSTSRLWSGFGSSKVFPHTEVSPREILSKKWSMYERNKKKLARVQRNRSSVVANQLRICKWFTWRQLIKKGKSFACVFLHSWIHSLNRNGESKIWFLTEYQNNRIQRKLWQNPETAGKEQTN